MEALNKRLEQLQRDKVRIEREINNLNEQRQTVLTDFIRTLMPMDIDPRIIIGGLIHVLDQAQTQPTTAEVWRQAGQKFWRQTNAAKTRTSTRPVQPQTTTAQQTAQATTLAPVPDQASKDVNT